MIKDVPKNQAYPGELTTKTKFGERISLEIELDNHIKSQLLKDSTKFRILQRKRQCIRKLNILLIMIA